MRQSPKPYAKGKERQNPSSSPVPEVLPRQVPFVHSLVRGLPKLGLSTSPFVGVGNHQPPVCPVGRSANVQPVVERLGMPQQFT